MHKTVFFSGTHGSGKTTTLDKVCENSCFGTYASADGDHKNPYTDPYPRQVWRLAKYYLDALGILEQESGCSGLLLVDRCIFDHDAYTKTFHKKGWLTPEQFQKIEELRAIYFQDRSLLPQNIVVFFPPEEWTINRIKQRWNAEKVKWNEGNFDYLRVLREEYKQIYEREKNSRNILLIETTKIEDRTKAITDFMKKLKSQQ